MNTKAFLITRRSRPPLRATQGDGFFGIIYNRKQQIRREYLSVVLLKGINLFQCLSYDRYLT
ncbi:hypothetical protein BH18THE2_BH18THE2_32250 [soil metagenome]